MSAIPSASAQEKVRLRVNVQVGEVYAFNRANETQMTTKATADNGQSQTFNTKMHQHRAGRMEILAVSDGKPTSVRLTFADTCESIAEMPGQPTRNVPYPYAGQTVTVTRAADGTVHDDFKGEVDPQSRAELHQALDPDNTFHPNKEIAIGEEWPGDPKEIAKQFQLTGPSDRGEMTLKLLAVRNENGRRLAEVKVSTAVIKDVHGLTIKTIIQGAVLMDLRTGHSLKGEMKGTITQSGNGTNPGPKGEPVNYHIEQEGTLTISMSFEPVEATNATPT